MSIPVIVPIRRKISAGDRLCFVRGREVAEGTFTVKSIDGLNISFVEKLPGDISADDVLIPESWAVDPEFLKSYLAPDLPSKNEDSS